MSQIDLERAILGDVISDGSLCQDEIFSLTIGHFEEPKHAKVFEILQEMRADKKTIDFLTLEHEVEAKGLSERLHHGFIVDLMEYITTPAHVMSYITILKRNFYLRHIKTEITRLNPELSPADIEHLMTLIQARDSGERRMVVLPDDFITEYIADLKTKKSAGIDTGFHTLDKNLHSQAGDLVVVGARTNVGKTTYLTNILVNMLNDGIPCLYAATEMRPKQFMDRISPLVSNVSAYNFRSREFTDNEVLELDEIGVTILKMPLRMLDIAGPNIHEIAQAIKSSECKVLFLDYLGRCSMPKENTRMREIEKFVVSLKNLCVERGVLCFLAVQLSRATDYNKDSEPRLADLSDSSAIEKEADAVVFLWKDPAKNIGGGSTISAVLAKNRHGLLSSWSIDFDKHRMRMIETGYMGKENNWNEPEQQNVF